jgi:hypothetical protein
VVEPLAERALRSLARFAGLDDPNTDIFNTVNPLISIFKNKAARELSTKAYLESAKHFGPVVEQAAQIFASRYPRVAAHARLDRDLTALPVSVAYTDVPVGRVVKPVPIKFGPLVPSLIKDDPDLAKELVFHEGTHVAQALGLPQMQSIYRLARMLMGYHKNPLEAAAFHRGLRARLQPNQIPARGPSGALPRPEPAMEAIRRLIPNYQELIKRMI